MMTTPDAAVDTSKKSEHEPVNVHYDTRLPDLPWSRRIQIPVIAAAVYSVIRMLGPTLRYEVLGWQHAERVYAAKKQCIWAFWHRVIIPVVWWYRNHGVVVMNTTAFDGQWTRKVIEWLGYGTAQGSSTRGGLRGLAVMAERLEQGRDVAFTFYGPPIYVPKDADTATLESKYAEMQRELERVRDLAESWFSLSEEARARHQVQFDR